MTNSTEGNAVLAFLRSARGGLRFVDAFPTGADGTGAGLGNQGGLVLDRSGNRLLVVNAGSDSITGLVLGRDGVVTLLDADGFTAPAGDGPIDAALSRNSRYLYVLNGREGSLSSYRVLKDGHLEPLARVGGLPAGSNGLAARQPDLLTGLRREPAQVPGDASEMGPRGPPSR